MGQLKDLTGQRFGSWTVLYRDDSVQKKNIYWRCRCDCGTERSVAGTSLRSGISVSCGCKKDEATSIRTKSNVDDLTGQRFGHWIVLCQDLSNENTAKGSRWICKCDCGNEKSVLGYSLRFGRTTSCGHCINNSKTIKDLTGQRFVKLTVLRKDDSNYDRQKGIKWICKCDCGNEKSILGSRLRNGTTQSCGCLQHSKRKHEFVDLTGQIIGKWTVLKKDVSKKGQGTYYICQCECGTIRSIPQDTLKRGNSLSCGCMQSIPKEDLTGQRFGKLLVLGLDSSKGKGIQWRCKCDCGTIKSYRANVLQNHKVISCGCISKSMSSDRNFIDISGKQFGRLTAICVDHKDVDNDGNTSYYWKCKCECGNEKIVDGSLLRNGNIKSCGCLQREESARRAKERTVDLHGMRFGLLTVIDRVSIDDSGISTWRCKCDCGNEKLADGYYLRTGMISSCGCLKQSKYELFVTQYFTEKGYINGIDYECQKRFDDLRGYDDGKLSYDFCRLIDGHITCFIECQGKQHYEPIEYFGGEDQFAKQQIHDELKRDYAKKLGIPLIELPYTIKTYEEMKSVLISYNI